MGGNPQRRGTFLGYHDALDLSLEEDHYQHIRPPGVPMGAPLGAPLGGPLGPQGRARSRSRSRSLANNRSSKRSDSDETESGSDSDHIDRDDHSARKCIVLLARETFNAKYVHIKVHVAMSFGSFVARG